MKWFPIENLTSDLFSQIVWVALIVVLGLLKRKIKSLFFLVGRLCCFQWYIKKEKELIEKELESLKKLKKSNQELSIIVFISVFRIFGLIGISLLFHAALAFTSWEKFSVLVYWLCGAAIYWIACDLLGRLQSLKNYDKTIDRLNQKIKKLKDKIKKKS